MRIVNAAKTNDVVHFWKDYVDIFHQNNHQDNMSLLRLGNHYGILMNERYSVHLMYYDQSKNLLFHLEEAEILPFIDNVANSEHKEIGVNEHADIILNILCKKLGMCYVSDLRKKQINDYSFRFIDKSKYDAEYKYVIHYLQDE